MSIPVNFEIEKLVETPRRHPGRGNPSSLPKSKGRPHGAVNVIARDLRRGIIDAAVELGSDGAGTDGLRGYLKHMGWHHPRAFASLLVKILPTNVSADITSTAIARVVVQSIPAGSYLTREGREAMTPPLTIDQPPQHDDDIDAEPSASGPIT